MTITNTANKSGPYNGNGVTTVFARNFKILHADHLKVYQTIGTTTTEVTTGIVKNGVDQDTGDVTFLVAPLSGTKITLIREVPISQETDYSNEGTVEPEQIEDDLDKSYMILQDLQEQVSRSYKEPLTGGTFTEGNLPQYDSNGLLEDSGFSAASVSANALASANNAAASASAAAASAVEAAASAAAAAASNPALLMEKSQNLADVASVPAAIVNLGVAAANTLMWVRVAAPVVVTNQANARITGFLPASFGDYQLNYRFVIPSVDGAELRLRTSSDEFATAADNGANDYGFGMTNPREGSGLTQDADDNHTLINLTGQVSNFADRGGASGEIRIISPASLNHTHFDLSSRYLNDSSLWRVYQGAGVRREAAAVNGLELFFNSGNISGVFELWGTPLPA